MRVMWWYRGSCRPRQWRSSTEGRGRQRACAPTLWDSTPRGLLDAHGRISVFAGWAAAPALREWMEAYSGERVLMSRTHHNCLMTKHPLYGSLTNWHRDVRYWSFGCEELISVWFALGEEHV